MVVRRYETVLPKGENYHDDARVRISPERTEPEGGTESRG
jgi:hypothetical protein